MKINPADLLLTVLVVAGLAVLAAFGLTDKEVPDVVTYLITTALGALVARMVPGARTTPDGPRALVTSEPRPLAVFEDTQPAADRRVPQPEDRPWETR